MPTLFYYIYNFNFIYNRGGAGRGGAGQYPNPPRVLKKNLKPVPYPFRKIISHPIRGGAGRVPEMTRPIAIPSICYQLSETSLSYLEMFPFKAKNLKQKFEEQPFYIFLGQNEEKENKGLLKT